MFDAGCSFCTNPVDLIDADYLGLAENYVGLFDTDYVALANNLQLTFLSLLCMLLLQII